MNDSSSSLESLKSKGVRRKVSKACENCRRRKIKCSGKYPCTSCEAYACDCVFDQSDMIPRGPKRLKKEKDITSDTTTTTTTSDTINSKSKEDFDTASTKISAYDKVICSKDNSFTGLEDLPSIPLNTNDSGFYKDDKDVQNELIKLQSILKTLRSLPHSQDDSIKEAIDNIDGQVQKLIENLEPEIDYEALRHFFIDQKHPSKVETTKSVETQLMLNRYTEHIHLTRFSTISSRPNTKQKTSTSTSKDFLSDMPLIDEFFGLYSPVLALSLRGIGYCFQKCFSRVKSDTSPVELKETLYLLLRFFDFYVDQLTQSCVSIANPVENYIQRKNLLVAFTPNSATSFSSHGTNNNKDLIVLLINQLKQPFVKNLANVTSEQLIENIDNDFTMFALVLQISKAHKEAFEQLMIECTSPSSYKNLKVHPSPEMIETFRNFSEQEELILALCYNYYNSTLYHFDDYNNSLDYLELLLNLLDFQLWLGEHYAFEKVFDVALNYATKMGLPRWEFYVGMNEKVAERRRQLWWRLYCFEKRFSSKKGYAFFTDDSKINCLLTTEFRDAGFIDNNDFLQKVSATPETSVLQNMSLSSLAFYGTCGTLQVYSNFTASVLYGERYTSIRNSAKHPFFRLHLLKEVVAKVEEVKEAWQAIKVQTSRLYKVAFQKQAVGEVTCHDRLEAVRFVFLHEYLICNILSSVCHLMIRLAAGSIQEEIMNQIAEYSNVIHKTWSGMSSMLLAVEDGYTVNALFEYYAVLSLLVVSSIVVNDKKIELDESIILLRVISNFKANIIYGNESQKENLGGSRSYKDYDRNKSFLAIVAHIMLLGCANSSGIEKNELLQELAKVVPDMVQLAEEILDVKSGIFKYLLEPVEESGFHLNVRKMIEREYKERKFGSSFVPPTKTFNSRVKRGSSVDKLLAPIQTPQSLPLDSGISFMAKPSLAKGNPMPLDSLHSTPNDSFGNVSPQGLDAQFPYMFSNNGLRTGYNLGTLDEFVNNGNLDYLYNALWSGLETDEYFDPVPNNQD